ncbi:OmpP1/FadL family transporter [Alteriqipengyuania sp. 357]
MTKPLAFALRALPALAVLSCAHPALAGAFLIQEQSAKETGRALSGAAVAADGPASIYFNPASMTELEGVQIEAASQFLFLTAAQEDQGSTRGVPGLPVSVPTGGSNGGNPFPQPLLVPSGAISAQLSDNVWAGIAVNAPFGLIADYDDDFFGRYDTLRADVFTLNVQPSLAVKIGDRVSVGAGLDVQYVDVELTNAVPNLAPTDADGLARVTGDDISIGWNAGVMVDLDPVRIGAHYRSQVKHNLEGTFELTGLTGPLAGNNATVDASAPLTLPDIATLSIQFGTDTPWRVFGTWRYYNWSDFEQIAIYPEGGVPPQVSEQNYRDSWSMSLGGEYDVSDKLTLRAGTTVDESPITDEFRSARVPDGDRVWAAAGLTYNMSERFSANLAYSHVFVKSAPIDRTDSFFEGTPAEVPTTIRSFSTGDADIVAVSLGARF